MSLYCLPFLISIIGSNSYIPSTDQINCNIQDLFKCKLVPDISKKIYKYKEDGTLLASTSLEQPYRIYVNKSIISDVCGYLEGVSECIQRSHSFIEMHCPAQLQLVDNFSKMTNLLCTLYRADIEAILECANEDNSKLMTYASCMQGAYKYLTGHTMQDCGIVERFRVCHCQFESCPADNTSIIKDMFTKNRDLLCYWFGKFARNRTRSLSVLDYFN